MRRLVPSLRKEGKITLFPRPIGVRLSRCVKHCQSEIVEPMPSSFLPIYSSYVRLQGFHVPPAMQVFIIFGELQKPTREGQVMCLSKHSKLQNPISFFRGTIRCSKKSLRDSWPLRRAAKKESDLNMPENRCDKKP